MGTTRSELQSRPARPAWQQALATYQQPNLRLAWAQLLPTGVGYLVLMTLMVLAVRAHYPYVLTLALAIPAGGLLMRIFVFFHDACHRSFFRSNWANTVLGYVTGILTFTPYHCWRAAHLRHHTTAGDLDRRGTGDVWTMTVAEYRAAPRLAQLAYRVFRHPLGMFGLGPGVVFLLVNRLPPRRGSAIEHLSVHATTLAAVAVAYLVSRTVGLGAYVAVQLPVVLIAATSGVWLFYVQHQFEGVYWSRHAQWDPIRSALEGSSFYRLPGVLQWFSGNIGLHHVHHLRPRIPNYNLQRCLAQSPELQQVAPLTPRASLRCLGLALWDEASGRLVSFAALRAAPR